jgi:hypothetical protein
VAADGDERERRVGGGNEREREREKGGSMSFSRFGNTTTGDERRNVDFSSIDLDSYQRTIPGLGGKTAAIPRDYRAIVVDDVAADPFTFVWSTPTTANNHQLINYQPAHRSDREEQIDIYSWFYHNYHYRKHLDLAIETTITSISFFSAMQNVSQAATLATATPNALSSLPLPSLVADSLAKFGLFASTADEIKRHVFSSSSFWPGSSWSAEGSSRSTLGQQGGWMNKQVLGSLLAMVATLLVLEQVSTLSAAQPIVPVSLTTVATTPQLPPQAVYRYKKAHLPGAKWTIPLIGKFKDSMDPRLEGYKRQWASGELSVTSVFNM